MRHGLTILLMFTAFMAQAQTQVYELTDQDSLDIDINQQSLNLIQANNLPEINELSISGCSIGPCQVVPGINRQVTVITTNTSRCRVDAPELGWQQLWTGAGTRHFLTPVVEVDTTLTVTCDNPQFAMVSTALEVHMEQSTCSNTIYPPGLSIVTGAYANYNDGFDFGTTTNASFELTLSTNQFAALSGVSLPANFRRRVVLTDPPTQRLIEQATISVSTCPGDFTESGAVCLMVVDNSSNLFFSTRPEDADHPINFCVLEPDTPYYINYVTSPSPYTNAPNCQGSNSCTIFYSEAAMAAPSASTD